MRLLLVGGDVSASKSPAIHQVMLRLADIDGRYEAISCGESELTSIVDRLRTGEVAGINVTMPHKQLASGLCDVLRGAAETSRSVNTLRVADGQVEGWSTDSLSFEELWPQFDNYTGVHVLGTGGAAMAALATTGNRPAYVSGRDPAAAHDVAARSGAQKIGWGVGVAGALVVNSTPIGSKGESLPRPILDRASGLIDLPYGPETTPAIARCLDQRISCVDGFDFLVRQAVHSFNLWTGAGLEFERVRTAL